VRLLGRQSLDVGELVAKSTNGSASPANKMVSDEVKKKKKLLLEEMIRSHHLTIVLSRRTSTQISMAAWTACHIPGSRWTRA
jgi:hypothetical protein